MEWGSPSVGGQLPVFGIPILRAGRPKRGIMKTRVSLVMIGLALLLTTAGFAQPAQSTADPRSDTRPSVERAVIYVMPNALMSPGAGNSSQVLVGSTHNGKEPQVAKIYQELQHNKACQGFSENIIKDKADYFLLLQHGGGVGNRWAVSGKDGSVIASGQAFTVGKSVADACAAIAKDWKSTAAR